MASDMGVETIERATRATIAQQLEWSAPHDNSDHTADTITTRCIIDAPLLPSVLQQFSSLYDLELIADCSLSPRLKGS